MEAVIKILVYGDIDLNVIDGSSIWLQSIVAAFDGVPNTAVTLLAKSPIERDEVVRPLQSCPNTTIIDPRRAGISEKPLSPFQVRMLIQNGDLGSFDAVVVRGLRIVRELTRDESTVENLWVYLTDIPQLAQDLGSAELTEMNRIAERSAVLLCQTEGLRSHFEDLSDAAVGKSWVLPPMIPEPPAVRPDRPISAETQLIYAGKFAPLWNTLEMCEIPALLAERGIEGRVTMIGDKIHSVPGEPTYRQEMATALSDSEGIDWVGRKTRIATIEAMAEADIGLAWRHADLSESLELSTKLLEYASAGVPFILNRTPDHEELVGHEYPLFADTMDEVIDVIVSCVIDPEVYDRARSTSGALAAQFSIARSSQRLARLLDRVVGGGDAVPSAHLRKLLVMSHDFKFFEALEAQLRLTPDFAIERDTWTGLYDHDPGASAAAMANADTIVCEWCGPNAVFASRNKRPDQNLIVRLHRFELYRSFPRDMDIQAVDRVVVVNDHYRELALGTFGWEPEKVIVIPNWVDTEQFARPKIGEARFNIGVIGIAPPTRKRFDRALEVLELLQRADSRYTLFVKSKPPWGYPYMWSNEEERKTTTDYVRYLRREPKVNGSVAFDRFGPDVARWLRKIGFVLSTSDDESFHLAPAEGMASGAIPVVFRWPGAETVYESRWLHASSESMADFILSSSSPEQWQALREQASHEVESISLTNVVERWEALLRNPASTRTWGRIPSISEHAEAAAEQ